MIRNYFKIALRNILHSKLYTFINVLGLAIGISTCTLIALYVVDELSYDLHHQGADRIYRIASEVKGETWVAAAAPVAAGLKKDFPEVEQTTRLLRMPGVDKFLLKNKETQKQFYEVNGFYVDSTFFQLFSYDFKVGDKSTALNQPNSLIISEQMASKLFGSADPIGQVIQVTLPFGATDYTVTGVLANSGRKSHIPAHLFLSMNNDDVGQWVKSQTNWAANTVFHTYLKLREGSSPEPLEAKLEPFLNRNGGDDYKAAGYSRRLFLQPLRSIYLHSNFGFEIAPNGNSKYLYILGSIAAFLLLIACVNFMNLSTARSGKRTKEVGIRKAIGALKGTLVGQFLGESVLLSFLALLLAVFFIQVLVPVFNQLTGKSLSFFEHPPVVFGVVVMAMVTGLLAGIYPAFYLSSFTPIASLKGKLKTSVSEVLIRKGLVVFQFTISIVLILGAILIDQQMKYLSTQNLGFNKNQKLVIPLQSTEAFANYDVLKTELTKNAQVIASTKGATYPGIENVISMLFYKENTSLQENLEISMAYVDTDYIKTLGIQLIEGRGFSTAFTADSTALVLNEAAVNKLGYSQANAVGKRIYFEFQGQQKTMQIIGVVKNYHFEGLQHEIKPLALSVLPLFSSTNNYAILDIKSANYERILTHIEGVWKKINPGSPFEYSFLDKDFQKNYEKEERTAQLIRYFALMAIFIACLGLFGLATFTAEQRTKEIGIRKVLGSSTFGIAQLLSFDFLKLVLLAILIASPLAGWIMHKWLSAFAYKTTISWSVFALAGMSAVLIALATVSFQAIRAALMNPVKSLKTE
ncbi:ABC transporter permease [Rhabdobacter roseus]|uniref:Putative ABC transport system permease protein n=1 Tax=Rhabdobacter roseus TaxID=1655419 RepID=A0A840TZL4_9BACT|nr:ABC transporter permease [Rhabdobacter roseus]MBB5285618.1 putative ABC transport system permease protein [Rhabdobacter roseus]